MVWVPGLLKRRLCRYGNGARIFDESAFAGQSNEVPATPSDRAHGGASALLAVVLAPLSLLACFSQPPSTAPWSGASSRGSRLIISG
ncbi:unnamed protein product [Spirodela intermedia]|uniref:Uncharacterized protein n=1 Tax=Spirodela intermedia TaxID=51605 RepID=A0A7I8JL94_SPIIN|nr:unnamed protein product [Spirodela intermedia]CAA6670840.1 unnamed protein product [Spirodela intermedia]